MYQYQHGGDIYSESNQTSGKKIVDFSANINPLGLPQGIRKAIIDSLDSCINYPDAFCRRLRAATADFLEVSPEYLFFGNGAADVLFRLVLAVRPRTALLLAPTFADYEKALHTVNCQVDYYKLSHENFMIAENILDQIQPGLEMVVICNPNNPTGKICAEGLLLQILQRCRECGTLLLIDECFMDFVPEDQGYSFRKYLQAYSNLVILKAFTKTFAIPGVRLGYCLTSNAAVLEGLHEMGQDWNVSIMAQEAGIAAVKETEYLKQSLAYVQKERIYLLDNLKKLPGITTYDSLANYIFFRVDPEPADFAAKLKAEGLLIRSCANYRNLDAGYYRIAVKKHEENETLIATLKLIMNNE